MTLKELIELLTKTAQEEKAISRDNLGPYCRGLSDGIADGLELAAEWIKEWDRGELNEGT